MLVRSVLHMFSNSFSSAIDAALAPNIEYVAGAASQSRVRVLTARRRYCRELLLSKNDVSSSLPNVFANMRGLR